MKAECFHDCSGDVMIQPDVAVMELPGKRLHVCADGRYEVKSFKKLDCKDKKCPPHTVQFLDGGEIRSFFWPFPIQGGAGGAIKEFAIRSDYAVGNETFPKACIIYLETMRATLEHPETEPSHTRCLYVKKERAQSWQAYSGRSFNRNSWDD
jgi:hypothetical protein